MMIDHVVIEGPTCAGKDTFIKELNRVTGHKWCLINRGNLSGVVEARLRGRDNWTSRERMLKRSLQPGMGTVYILLDTEENEVRRRWRARGDDVVTDEEALGRELAAWREYLADAAWLRDNVKFVEVRDVKAAISALGWLEANVADARAPLFNPEHPECNKPFREGVGRGVINGELRAAGRWDLEWDQMVT